MPTTDTIARVICIGMLLATPLSAVVGCSDDDTGDQASAGSSAGGGQLDGGVGGQGGKAGSGGASGGNAGHAGSAGSGTGGGSGGAAGSTGGSAGSAGSAGGTQSAWRPFNDASPWNTRIPDNPTLDPNSDALIADFSTVPGQTFLWVNIEQYSIPVYWVDSTSTPMVTVQASVGGTGFRDGAVNEWDAAASGQAPIPSNAEPAAGTDRHLSIIDRQTQMEWGFWNANPDGSNWTAGTAATMDLSGSGVRPPTEQDPWWAGHGPRACGYSAIAGLITVEQLQSGVIDHALIIAYPHIRSRYYTPPASTAQGTTGDAQPDRGIPCGGQVQLDPTLDINSLGLSAAGVTIARALQVYGAFVGDYSGSMSVYADSSPDAQAYWSSGVLGSGDVQSIPLNRFRVLQLGQLYDNEN